MPLTLRLPFLYILALTALHTRAQPPTRKDSFPAQVGEIHYLPGTDDPTFNPCNPNRILEYYNTGSWYLEHKRSIESWFRDRYKPPTPSNNPPPNTPPGAPPPDTSLRTGYLTIRFVISCEGRTGWFRLSSMDTLYQPAHLDTAVTGRLLELTRQITGWQPATYRDAKYDSYQYLTFKLKSGRIECIMP
jgi:hypothetical protein